MHEITNAPHIKTPNVFVFGPNLNPLPNYQEKKFFFQKSGFCHFLVLILKCSYAEIIKNN